MVMRNNGQVLPFLTAKQAKENTRRLITDPVRDDLYAIGNTLNTAITRAIANKQTSITVQFPVGLPDDIVQAMKRTFRKKGFLARVTTTQGLFEQGLVWQPRTYITLSWF